MPQALPADPAGKHRFGTFGGVFTPSILTILGVIMFMRANYVVGQAGILGAVAILLIAKSITFLTSLSISAISTNMQVKGGGAYYMISRVLGPEFGGAIGVALFFALALSVPFYVIGFTEAVIRMNPGLAPHFLPITVLTACALFFIAYVGAGWAIRTQYVIMAVLFTAIAVFMAGAVRDFTWTTLQDNLWGYDPATETADSGVLPLSFWVVFAIYFPAVTGIDAGVNMSGDLKDPARSIPNGTLAAVGVGFLIYLSQILVAGGAFPRVAESGLDMLRSPFELLTANAIFGLGFVVAAGMYAASLSSALGSFLAGPRVLQAISRDPILPFLKPFALGTRQGDEPRRALALVGVITLVVLLWAGLSRPAPVVPLTEDAAAIEAAASATSAKAEGEGEDAPLDPLNAVAAVVTMFFLFSYGTINLAAFIEAAGENPSFRPRFRYFHWGAALVGALGCLATACLINFVAALVAAVLVAGLIWYVRAQQLENTFGDARRGFFYTQARDYLLRLARMPEDSRNWRPTALVFSGNPETREQLVRFAVWLVSGRGMVYLANLLVGEIEELAPRRRAAHQLLAALCREKRLEAFPVVAVAPSLPDGVSMLLQTAAVGPIRPNLAVFGHTQNADAVPGYVRQLRVAAANDISTVILRPTALTEKVERRRIDVWWRGQKNGGLMLILAHLLTLNPEWDDAEIRVLRIIEKEVGRQPAMASLQALLHSSRVEATTQIIVSDRPVADVLRGHSADADCVFIGFEIPAVSYEEQWHQTVSAFLAGLPTVVMVNSRGDADALA